MMRMFAKINKEGTIISFCKVEIMPEGVDQPYADLGEGESVIEIRPTKNLEKMLAHEIHENHRVDTKTKELVKKKTEKKKPERVVE